MLYAIFKVLMRNAFKSYFRRISIQGAENIPNTGPVMLLCNHPSSFTEPMLLACFQHRILNFLVRGDIFENRLLKPLLEKTHQIPIYRARDGFENLRKNKGTFERVYQKLSERECVLIFPESTTQLVRYLRPLQKGAAHMCIASVREYHLTEMVVVPCGVNFNNVLKAGSDVSINIGTAINIQEWIEAQAEGTDLPTRLTEHFSRAMDEVVFSIPTHLSPSFCDQLSYIAITPDKPLAQRREEHGCIIRALNDTKDELEAAFTSYAMPHSKVELNEVLVTKSLSKRLFLFFSLLFSMIAGSLAAVFYSIPLNVSRSIAFHTVKNEFKTPIRIVVALLLILILNVVAWIVLWVKSGFLIATLILTGLWISFRLYLFFYFRRQLLSPALLLTNSSGIQNLKNQRLSVKTLMNRIRYSASQ